MHICCRLFLVAFCLLISLRPGLSQDRPKVAEAFNEFNAEPRDGWVWDEDDRLDDLIQQLQEKELALREVDALSTKFFRKKVGAKSASNLAWRSMDRMDLNGGGPVRWDAFYGRNAENFFYHPVDPSTTYHTTTALKQVQPTSAGGVAGNQGAPAHQRPPQFDYIYRGYERRQSRAREEAREIASKVDALNQRRKQLESEVVLLWVKIAFRVLDREKVAERAILRWGALPEIAGDKQSVERAAALTEATKFLATALLFNEKRAEYETDKVFTTVSQAVQGSRKKYEDSLLSSRGLFNESEDRSRPLGQYKLLGRKLEDASRSLTEGYRAWKSGDASDDEQIKFTGLRRVQDSVVTYAKLLLAMNELIDVMKVDWGLEVSRQGTEFVPSWDVAYTAPVPQPSPREMKPAPIDDSSKRTTQELQSQLRGTLWINNRNFFFSWDVNGRLWHFHKDRPNDVGEMKVTYVDGDTCNFLFLRNGARQKVMFSEDLKSFKQMTEDGERVVVNAVRVR